MDFLPLRTEGLVVEKPGGGFHRRAVVLDDMSPDEVLVRMLFSGICHTDIGGARGGYSALEYPAVLGHEGAGVVVAVGRDVVGVVPGRHVLLSFNHCGDCMNCRARHPACCAQFEALNVRGKRSDGTTPARLGGDDNNDNNDNNRLTSQFFGQSSFLRHAVVSQHSVVPLPETASIDKLGLYAALGCGFQTGAGTVLNALQPNPDDSLVIVGVGTVGLAAVLAARHRGLQKIIAVDRVASKLDRALALGATHVVDTSRTPDLAKAVQNLTAGEGARYAVDCTGAPAVLNTLLAVVCCGGTAVVVGSPPQHFALSVDLEQLLHENKTIRGICQGDSVAQDFIPEMIQLHQRGVLPLEELVTLYLISKFDEAVKDVLEGKVLKATVSWD